MWAVDQGRALELSGSRDEPDVRAQEHKARRMSSSGCEQGHRGHRDMGIQCNAGMQLLRRGDACTWESSFHIGKLKNAVQEGLQSN